MLENLEIIKNESILFFCFDIRGNVSTSKAGKFQWCIKNLLLSFNMNLFFSFMETFPYIGRS